MPLQIPVRAVPGALEIGVPQTPQELYEEMLAKASFFWDGSIGFQNGGTQPTSNVGPWLKNGNEWRFFDSVTGVYDLTVYTPGDILMTGSPTVDETTGWLLANGRQFSTADYPLLFGAIGYNFILDSDKTGGSPTDPTKFRIPNLCGRVPIGAGTGTDLTTRVLGAFIGSEEITLVEDQIPEHVHACRTGSDTDEGQLRTEFATADANGGSHGSINTGKTGGNPDSEDPAVSAPHDNMQPSIALSFKIKV